MTHGGRYQPNDDVTEPTTKVLVAELTYHHHLCSQRINLKIIYRFGLTFCYTAAGENGRKVLDSELWTRVKMTRRIRTFPVNDPQRIGPSGHQIPGFLAMFACCGDSILKPQKPGSILSGVSCPVFHIRRLN